MTEIQGTVPAKGLKGHLLKALLFFAMMFTAICIFFFPFVFEGEHILPFHFEPGESTAIPDGGARPSIYRKFPGNDNSPILIHYPNAKFTADCLRNGQLPTWNPYLGCGTPGMGNGQVYPFSPFFWPFYLRSTPWIFTLGLILGCIWSALGAFLWLGRFDLRDWRRYFGAIIWTFNPWTLKIIIYSNVWAAFWFGWLLWSWDFALKKDRKFWWLPAVMVTGMVYCGHPEVALLLAEASVVYAIILWSTTDRENRVSLPRFALRGTGIVCLTGLMTAIHVLPVIARFPDIYSYKFGHAEIVTASRYALENIFNPKSEVYLSPVIFGFLFLGLAFLNRSAKRYWSAFALLGFASLICFRPININPLMKLITLGGVVPGIYARSLLWCSLIPILAAGAGTLWDETGGRWRPLRLLILGPIAFAALSVASYQSGAMIYLFLRKDLILFYACCLVILTIASAIPRGKARAALLALGVVMICISPMMESAFRYSYFTRINPMENGPPAVAELKALQENNHGRFSSVNRTGWHAPCLSPDLASLWNLRDVRQVDALLTRRYVNLQLSLLPEQPDYVATWLFFKDVSMHDLGLLGVKWFGIPADRNSGQYSWEQIDDASPRAYLVHSVIPSPGEPGSRGLWELFHRRNDFNQTAILEGWDGPLRVGKEDSSDSVKWIKDGNSTVNLKVNSTSGGVLILLDTFDRGWKASIDGSPVHIYPANLAFRGIKIPAGEHDVHFHYDPFSVKLGLALSIVGWISIIILTLLPLFRRKL